MKFYLGWLAALMVVLGFFIVGTLKPAALTVKVEEPIRGLVTAKEWVPAHDDQHYHTFYNADGTFIMIPYFVYYDDEWRIYVGKRYANVQKAEFQAIEVQGYFEERRP